VAYVRTVKTASGAVAVQVVWSSRRGSRNIEHVGSTHDEAEVQVLKAAARRRIVEGQGELELGLDSTEIPGGPLEITGIVAPAAITSATRSAPGSSNSSASSADASRTAVTVAGRRPRLRR
jgi:hypothetical protein